MVMKRYYYVSYMLETLNERAMTLFTNILISYVLQNTTSHVRQVLSIS